MEVAGLGEGGKEGNLEVGKSPVFAVLEVCLIYPDISPRAAQSSLVIAIKACSRARSNQLMCQLTSDQKKLVAISVLILSRLSGLCSPAGSITVLPTILYLPTSTLKEAATKVN